MNIGNLSAYRVNSDFSNPSCCGTYASLCLNGNIFDPNPVTSGVLYSDTYIHLHSGVWLFTVESGVGIPVTHGNLKAWYFMYNSSGLIINDGGFLQGGGNRFSSSGAIIDGGGTGCERINRKWFPIYSYGGAYAYEPSGFFYPYPIDAFTRVGCYIPSGAQLPVCGNIRVHTLDCNNSGIPNAYVEVGLTGSNTAEPVYSKVASKITDVNGLASFSDFELDTRSITGFIIPERSWRIFASGVGYFTDKFPQEQTNLIFERPPITSIRSSITCNIDAVIRLTQSGVSCSGGVGHYANDMIESGTYGFWLQRCTVQSGTLNWIFSCDDIDPYDVRISRGPCSSCTLLGAGGGDTDQLYSAYQSGTNWLDRIHMTTPAHSLTFYPSNYHNQIQGPVSWEAWEHLPNDYDWGINQPATASNYCHVCAFHSGDSYNYFPLNAYPALSDWGGYCERGGVGIVQCETRDLWAIDGNFDTLSYPCSDVTGGDRAIAFYGLQCDTNIVSPASGYYHLKFIFGLPVCSGHFLIWDPPIAAAEPACLGISSLTHFTSSGSCGPLGIPGMGHERPLSDHGLVFNKNYPRLTNTYNVLDDPNCGTCCLYRDCTKDVMHLIHDIYLPCRGSGIDPFLVSFGIPMSGLPYFSLFNSNGWLDSGGNWNITLSR